jgi:hypothetical protein
VPGMFHWSPMVETSDACIRLCVLRLLCLPLPGLRSGDEERARLSVPSLSESGLLSDSSMEDGSSSSECELEKAFTLLPSSEMRMDIGVGLSGALARANPSQLSISCR